MAIIAIVEVARQILELVANDTVVQDHDHQEIVCEMNVV